MGESKTRVIPGPSASESVWAVKETRACLFHSFPLLYVKSPSCVSCSLPKFKLWVLRWSRMDLSL